MLGLGYIRADTLEAGFRTADPSGVFRDVQLTSLPFYTPAAVERARVKAVLSTGGAAIECGANLPESRSGQLGSRRRISLPLRPGYGLPAIWRAARYPNVNAGPSVMPGPG